MQLCRLDVVNIRSFERGRLDLGPGTTLVVGDVGAGKSSLLYAVEMALFGVAEVDAAFLIRHGTAHAEVGVTLEDHGHFYAVRRRFRKVHRRGREAYEPEKLTFAEDGRPTAYSATEIRQRVIDLLGFPDNPNPHAHSDLWRWAIYVPQERMREILAAHPEERLETVRKALGVERYRTAAENAQALSADLKLSARRRREEAARMAHWDTEFAEATREADRIRAERAALLTARGREEEALAAARGARQAKEADVARVQADRRELESLRREDATDLQAIAEGARRRDAASIELAAARKEAEALRPVADEQSSLAAARRAAEDGLRARREELERHAETLRELARAVTGAEAAERRKSEMAARSARIREERGQAARALAELESQAPTGEPPAPTSRTVPELERLAAAALAAEHEALDALARARGRLDQVTELLDAGVCPTCGQPVQAEEFAVHRDEAAKEVERGEAARAASAEHRASLEEERKARERFERAHERWQELERRRREAREAVGRKDAEQTVAVEAVGAADRELEGLRRTCERLRPVEAEVERTRAELASAEGAARELQGREERAGRAAERLRALASVSERLSSDTSRLEGDLARLARKRVDRAARAAALEAAVGSTEAAGRALEEARSAETAAERRLADAAGALVRADTRLDGLVERVASAERGRAERATLVGEATDLEAKADWVGVPFRTAVLRMEKELLAHAQSAFDRSFSRFFATLVDDPMLIARTDVSFTPEVTIAGEATPAEALSGGERTGLALAFRLALATVVRSLGAVRLQTLLLDEPTDGFSAEQVVRMGELLEELALPQVVIVSHESQLAGVADRTVRVVKADGRSTIEVEEPSAVAPEPREPTAEAPEAIPPRTGPARRRPR